MKKLSIKKLLVFIPVMLAVITGFNMLSVKSKNVFAYDELPSYVNVYMAEGYNDGENWIYTPKSSQGVFKQGDAFFLDNTTCDSLVINLGDSNLKVNNRIRSITYTLNVNGNVLDENYAEGLRSAGISFSENNSDTPLQTVFNPSMATNEFGYGRYQITYSYIYIDQNSLDQSVSFTLEFYLLNKSDYIGVKNFANTDGSNGANQFYYNYNNSNLITLTYDYTKFNLSITKLYQQLTCQTTIEYVGGTSYNYNVVNYDELEQITTNQYVKVERLSNDPASKDYNFLRITFNNIGKYFISYKTINTYQLGTTYYSEEFSQYYNYKNQAPNTSDTVCVYGYQSMLTTDSEQNEFRKQVDSITYKADISDIFKSVRDPETTLVSTSAENSTFINIKSTLITGTTNSIVKTNCAPIYFDGNAELSYEDNTSYYVYFKTSQDLIDFTGNVNSVAEYNANSTPEQTVYKVSNYTGTPLSVAGYYFVKLEYTFEGRSGSQYFLFEISNNSPEIKIQEVPNYTGDSVQELPSDSYTSRSITVTHQITTEERAFNSASTLKVYKCNFGGTYDAGTVVNGEQTFEQSAKYKAELTYGNFSQKKYITYFTIDKQDIENIKLYNTENYYGSQHAKRTEIANNVFSTTESVAISWNEKASGIPTYAEYKFFPITYSAEIANNLQNYYNGFYYVGNQTNPTNLYAVLSNYQFNYAGTQMPVANYKNTSSKSTLSNSEILSQSGLYIIRIFDGTDKTIEESQFRYIFIDKTPNEFLSVNNNVWTKAPQTYVTTQDYSVYFGQNKIFKFNNIIDTQDLWLEKLSTDENSPFIKNFVQFSNGESYLKIENSKYIVKEVTDEQGKTTTSLEILSSVPHNNIYYSDNLFAINNGKVNESQYNYYLVTTSNPSYSLITGDNNASINVILNNYNVKHSVTYSTDNSQMLVYGQQNQNYLEQTAVDSASTLKHNYFQPINEDNLILNYNIKPNANLTVESIKLEYYPFVKDALNPTYIFNNTPETTFNIYVKDEINLGTLKEGNTYVWNIYQESYSTSNNTGDMLRTKAGKYVITRKYLAGQGDSNNPNVLPVDPNQRVISFIVDRNGIISAPEFTQDLKAIYYTGSAIKLLVADKNDLLFEDVYYAYSLAKNEVYTPILQTNLLPVKVYIPEYKYGYMTIDPDTGRRTFIPTTSVINYKGSDTYTDYKLSATVCRYEYNNKTSKYLDKYELTTRKDGDGFLVDKTTQDILSVSAEGFYVVTIKDGIGETFEYCFYIDYKAPEFSLYDTNNKELYNVNNEKSVYYTNKSTINISWRESSSKYIGKIDYENIQYRVGNSNWKKLTPEELTFNSNTNEYFAKVDLTKLTDEKNESAYVNGKQIQFMLKYQGEPGIGVDESYYSRTVTLNIDTQAPVVNLNKLIKSSGLSQELIREYVQGYGNSYNVSKSTGLLQYYSFVVDVSNFEDLISIAENDTDCYLTYFNVFKDQNDKNTKYVIGNVQESDVTIDNFDGYTNRFDKNDYEYFVDTYINGVNNLVGKYIEFIEQDYAGNRTVYTILLTDILNSSYLENTVIELSEKVSTSLIKEDEKVSTETITRENIKDLLQDEKNAIELYAIFNLQFEDVNLFNQNNDDFKYYQALKVNKLNDKGEITTGIYVKTPYSNNKYYEISTFTDYTTSKGYTLQELLNFNYSEYNEKQSVEILQFPICSNLTIDCYVTNDILEYKLLSVYTGNKDSEGIAIKMPDINKKIDNQIYGKDLIIFYNNKNSSIKIDDSYLNGEALKAHINQGKLVENFESNQNLDNYRYKITYYYDVYGDLYFILQFTQGLTSNQIFYYNFNDNYNSEAQGIYTYSAFHIFGLEEIQQPITSLGGIVESYNQDGEFVYYSTEDVNYKFHRVKYPGDIQVELVTSKDNNNLFFTIKEKQKNKFEVYDNNGSVLLQSDYEKYLTINYNANGIFTLTLKQAKDFYLNSGDTYSYKVTITPIEESGLQQETTNFVIHNQIPQFTLTGENDKDVTHILGNRDVYTANVTINFDSIKAELMKYKPQIALIIPTGETIALIDGYQTSMNGNYKIVVNYTGLLQGLSKTLEFSIKDQQGFKYSVNVENSDGSLSEVKATGNSYTYKEGNATVVIDTHYITNKPVKIVLNETLNLQLTYKDLGNYSTLYTITNEHVESAILYYRTSFVVSVIPETNELFKPLGFVIYESDGSQNDLSQQTSTKTTIITKEGYDTGRKLSWSSYNLIESNKINVTVYYGEIGGTEYHPVVNEEENGRYSITLKTSGVYYFKFTDLAGNTHLFGNGNVDYFTMNYISSVIYEINGETPINHSYYNSDVVLSIDKYTLSNYDVSALPVLNVELNGKEYKPTKTDDRTWKFTEAGLYKVWFSAKILQQSVYELPLYFTILSQTESRSSFSYSAYGDYYIEDVLLNNNSIMKSIANENMGTVYRVDDVDYLKDLILHKYDIKTGQGNYTIVVNTNNEFGQKFSFTVWIKDVDVPIIISHPSGTKTKDNVTIEFLTVNILESAGDCIIKITGRDDLYITKELFEAGQLQESYNLPALTEAGEYFIEVTTLSGQLLFSSYIEIQETLNVASIILIVVACVAAVGLGILFFMLRRKMKVK